MRKRSGRTIVSAADAVYARTLFQLLLSVQRHAPTAAVVVFDIGMSAPQRRILQSRFPSAQVVEFDFANSPPHLRALHTCAWKPAAIETILEDRRELILWLDAGCIVRQPLEPVFSTIAREGVVSLAGQSPASRWCHPATFELMRVAQTHRSQRCRAGGVLGFDGSREEVRQLVASWRAWASNPDCVDPAGASRANHRYDQAILTNLLHAAAQDGRLRLQDEEIDVSSVNPVRWVSTRNKVASWMPLAADPAVRAWYSALKAIDRVLLRARGRSRAASYPPASVRTARR